ncbi:MAG: hypothetical protein KAJ42_00695, partial [Gemmatimonadetes bacterium]|nr:hypothetical protein [Gemmatimonadota bacterium]
VMTAHIAVPEILGPDAPPATLSPYFMRELLREDMGFGGVLFTDALRMGAISRRYGEGEAAVLALEAGTDVLLSPGDLVVTAEAVVEAVETGRLTRERIQASVRRILAMKARMGLHRDRFVDLEGVDEVVGSGSHLAFADSAAARAITLPRDRGGLVPVDPGQARSLLSVVYAPRAELVAGRELNALLSGTVDRLVQVRLDDASTPQEYESAARQAEGVDLVLVSPFVSPRSGTGTVGVPEALSRLVTYAAGVKPTAVLSFGNPYLLSAFQDVGSYLIAWGGREVSQRAAVRALFGETAITGKLPISLPPFHDVGEGLTREATGFVVGTRSARDPLAEAGFVPDRGESPTAGVVEIAPYETNPRIRELLEEVGGALASSLEVVAEEVGMDPLALGRLDSLILEAIADSATPGAALAVGRHGKLVRLRGFGR